MTEFNWQTTENKWLHWIMPAIVGSLPNEEMRELSQKTDAWTKISLGMTINGHSVNALVVLDRLFERYESDVRAEACRIVESENALREIYDLLEEASIIIKDKLRDAGLYYDE